MERKRIPLLNEKFDYAIFRHVVRRNIILSCLIFLIAALGAYAYLRYTQPVYRSASIVQLKNESTTANKILNLSSTVEEINNIQTIELIKSKEFLKRTFNKLPLDVSYFSQGTFLAYELYQASPFTITYKVNNSAMYGFPVFVSFEKNGNATLKYTINEEIKEVAAPQNTTVELNGLVLSVTINDLASIHSQINKIKNDSYFFIINDSESIYKKYSRQLEVSLLSQEANTVQISISDNNPTKTSEIVNKVAEEFIKYDVEKKKESSQKILDFIEKQNKSIYLALDSVEEQLMEFRYKHQIRSDKETNDETRERYGVMISKIEEDIDNTDLDIMALRRVIEEIEKKTDIKVYEMLSMIPSRNDGIFINLLNQLQTLMSQRDVYLNNQTQNSHNIKVIEKQIETLKQTIIELLKSNYSRANEKKAALVKKLMEYELKIYGSSSVYDLEYLKLKRLYTINEDFYNKLLEKKAEYMISQAGSVSQNIILENAIAPVSPIAPIPKTIISMFIIAALIINICIVVIRYLLYNEITSPDDIRSYTDVSVVGLIPLYKARLPISQLLVDVKLNSVFSEAFRSVRSSLDFLKNIQGPKVIAISSTISGEGKTFVGLNLGGIYAIQGKKVILLDLDLRKPRFHLCFNTDNSKGISTILIGKYKFEDCIKKSKINNLDFITAGPVPPNPSELTAGAEVDVLLNSLKEIYDVIIIDTPPIGLVTDALNIFNKCDFPLYIIKANYSKRAFLYNLNHLYDEKHIQNLSVVLNGIDIEKSKYGGYYYGYGYGYGYGNTEYHHDYYDESAKVKKRSFFRKIISRL